MDTPSVQKAIELYRKFLERDLSPAGRRGVQRLLAEEEKKFRILHLKRGSSNREKGRECRRRISHT